MSNLNRGPSIDASYQVLVHLAKRILKISKSETRGPSIDASYQISDHLAKQFQRRRFLEIDQSKTRIACGGHIC
jgi:hypothetical protein